MTPKTVALTARQQTTLREFYDKHSPIPHSRIPVLDSESGLPVGILLKDILLKNLVDGQDNQKISEIIKPVTLIEDTATLPQLFQDLAKQKVHLMVVTDNFGSMVGIVTLEDLFETLF